jgi:hypothetical protein
LDESFRYDIPQVSHKENTILSADFIEKKEFEAIMQKKKNKAPGPDGFPAEFYHSFWEIIKIDLMRLFEAFQYGDLPLFHLNYGTIVLLTKEEDATQIQQYRLICLLNVSFKFFTNIGTNWVTKVALSVIRPTQTAFMPGRHILEGVLVFHELHRKKLDGVLLKIDFKKAYDKVKWPFLHKILRTKGFDSKWCKWINDFESW